MYQTYLEGAERAAGSQGKVNTCLRSAWGAHLHVKQQRSDFQQNAANSAYALQKKVDQAKEAVKMSLLDG